LQNNTTCLKFLPSECTLGVSNICNANAMMPCSSFSYSNTRGVTIAVDDAQIHCTSGPSPCIYKREVQGLPARGVARGNEQTNMLTLSLSLSLSRDACNPYYEHPRCEIIQATFPPCVPSCANPSGQGHAAINSLVGSVEGPPGPQRRQYHSFIFGDTFDSLSTNLKCILYLLNGLSLFSHSCI
jgi:hypothetical protein